jgi:hypothetical protein
VVILFYFSNFSLLFFFELIDFALLPKLVGFRTFSFDVFINFEIQVCFVFKFLKCQGVKKPGLPFFPASLIRPAASIFNSKVPYSTQKYICPISQFACFEPRLHREQI